MRLIQKLIEEEQFHIKEAERVRTAISIIERVEGERLHKVAVTKMNGAKARLEDASSWIEEAPRKKKKKMGRPTKEASRHARKERERLTGTRPVDLIRKVFSNGYRDRTIDIDTLVTKISEMGFNPQEFEFPKKVIGVVLGSMKKSGQLKQTAGGWRATPKFEPWTPPEDDSRVSLLDGVDS
jgi:hypothetical protein